MKLAAIVNPMSRSVPKNGAEQLEAAIRDTGHEIVQLAVASEALHTQVRNVAASQADAIVAWGGDGTLACTLTASCQSGLPVLALPGGTMNMLPNRLHGEAPWHDVLDKVLSSPGMRTICAGEANGKRFYVAALFGRLTGFAEAREAVRKAELIDAAQSLVERNVLDVETRLRLSFLRGARKQRVDAVAAAIVLSGGEVPAFEVSAIDPESTLDLLATAIDAMIHGWKEAEPVERGEARSVRVEDLCGGGIPVTLDGEQVNFVPPVRVRMIEQAARVLCAGGAQ